MTEKYFFASLTRISDLDSAPFETHRLPRSVWADGDYVATEVISPPGRLVRAELHSGRMIDLVQGDLVMGALGVRLATLEAVGDWRKVDEDGRMHAMTAAGLFGKVTSISPLLSPLAEVEYVGHAVRDGKKLTMADFAANVDEGPYEVPTVLIIGTSMSSGKTTSAKVIVRMLKEAGLRVVGAKLTGAGRYRDILAMHDAGADSIFDFVDAGLPSSICAPEVFERAVTTVLGLMARSQPDVAVVEAGASPFEPYNGDIVMKALGDSVAVTVLCASDPYAVLGVMKGFDVVPDIAAGIATSTSAGVDLIEKLTGVRALNLLDHSRQPEMRDLLLDHLGLTA